MILNQLHQEIQREYDRRNAGLSWQAQDKSLNSNKK